MKALVTGSRRLHRIASGRGAARSGRGPSSASIAFTDYYPRAIKEAEPRQPPRDGPASSFVEDRIQDAIRRSLLTERHPCVSSRGAGRCAQELGTGFPRSTPTTTSMPRSGCSRRASGRPLRSVRLRVELVALRRQRVDSRCAKTRCRSRSRPYGVTKLAAEQLCYLYFVNSRRADVRRYAISRSTGHGSGRTWPFTDSCARRSTGRRSCSTATANRPATSRS